MDSVQNKNAVYSLSAMKPPQVGSVERKKGHVMTGFENTVDTEESLKFCKHCGEKIPEDAIVCTKCGRQVEEIKKNSDQIIINNNNSASAAASASAIAIADGLEHGRPKNKWVALALCVFTICGHKFYEGKVGMGVIYLFTAGLFFVGWIADIISLLLKPNPYYV